MYSTLAKSMVEFVANSHDGEATYVDILIPFDAINAKRAEVRAEAKQAVADGKMEPFTVLLLPLPDDLKIVITDDGHGMDPQDVENKFLPINRKRRFDEASKRESNLDSETGKRKVMGRKGLGKLAGFGVAEMVTIKTKRAEDNFWTIFELDYRNLSDATNLGNVKIPATYLPGTVGEKGTTITLSRLRCDALKRGEADLRTTLDQNFFGIRPADFAIKINGNTLLPPAVEYQYTYPVERPHDGFAREVLKVPDLPDITFDYVVKFRMPGNSLKNNLRGARVYCHNRLAAGPSLFNLPSGVHNFHGQDYMECVIQANQLDEIGIDLVSTDRTQLKGESEVVIAFLESITAILKAALTAHYNFKTEFVDKEIQSNNPGWIRVVDAMDKKTREPTKKLLRTLGTQFGVGSKEYNELAPLVMNTVSAGEVLIRLIEVGVSPKEITDISSALLELAEVEKSQALTVFRGKLSGIQGLRQLVNKSDDEWRKKQYENDLHNLLKKHPWLIRQEFTNHLTSDETLQTTCSELAKELGVDHYAEDAPKKAKLRPDLVFLMNDPQVFEVIIVELKSPTIPLEDEHLQQLIGYMAQVDAWLRRKFTHAIKISGFLIGTREKPDKRTQGANNLEYQIASAGPSTNWRVFDLRELLRNTENTHAEIIKAIENDLGEDHILNVAKHPASAPATAPAAVAAEASVATETTEASDEAAATTVSGSVPG